MTSPPLRDAGFATGTPGDADVLHEHTTVLYPTGGLAAGQLVARHITGGVVLEDRSVAPGEVTVVAGVEFTTVHEEPTLLDQPAAPGEGPPAGTDRPPTDRPRRVGPRPATTRDRRPCPPLTTSSPALVGAVPDGAC